MQAPRCPVLIGEAGWRWGLRPMMEGFRWVPCWVWLTSIPSISLGPWNSPSPHPQSQKVYTGPELGGQPYQAHSKCWREVPTEVTLMGQQSQTLIAGGGGVSQHEGTRG